MLFKICNDSLSWIILLFPLNEVKYVSSEVKAVYHLFIYMEKPNVSRPSAKQNIVISLKECRYFFQTLKLLYFRNAYLSQDTSSWSAGLVLPLWCVFARQGERKGGNKWRER